LRYVLFALAAPSAMFWLIALGILLHGVCYDFFFMTGQLYTDMQAPQNLRGAAQGLIIFLTYGVGMFIGSMLSGTAVDYFSHNAGGAVVRDWKAFWLSSSTGAFVILLMILVAFRSRAKVHPQEAAAMAD